MIHEIFLQRQDAPLATDTKEDAFDLYWHRKRTHETDACYIPLTELSKAHRQCEAQCDRAEKAEAQLEMAYGVAGIQADKIHKLESQLQEIARAVHERDSKENIYAHLLTSDSGKLYCVARDIVEDLIAAIKLEGPGDE